MLIEVNKDQIIKIIGENHPFVVFCEENNCMLEAFNILYDVYNDKDYLNIFEDFEENNISIGHIEDVHDIHLCNTCYDAHEYCRWKKSGRDGVCKFKIEEEIYEKACTTLDKSCDDCNYYRHIGVKDIIIKFYSEPIGEY